MKKLIIAFLEVAKQVRLFGRVGGTGSIARQLYINVSDRYAETFINNER